MFAAGLEGSEDAQIRVGEKPAFGLAAGDSCGAHERAEMLATRDGAKMLGADSRQSGNFVFGEDFFCRFDSDHFLDPFLNPSRNPACCLEAIRALRLRHTSTSAKKHLT
jgi:hypothetical protein